MHDLEPYYQWRDDYISEEDELSPFYQRDYSEFHFTNKVYNYFIHPQWDDFGSSTLYLKLLYVDYDDGYAIIELIGEWNDAIHNDIMFFKRDVADHLMQNDISKFILIGENVLNFHNSDDDYYAEWYDDLQDQDGWVVCLGLLPHVIEEMNRLRLFHYFFYGLRWNSINWRSFTPQELYSQVEEYVDKPKLLPG